MDRVRKLVGADCAYRQGCYGEGIGVAVLDSGFDSLHPDLRGRLAYSYNYFNRNQDVEDDCGHGTHVSGIIGGTGVASGGRYQGLAPRCHFVSLKVLDGQGKGNSNVVAEALYWLVEHGREYDVRIINISVGGAAQEQEGSSRLLRAVEEAWNAGFVVCAAAGNQGPKPYSITVPGTSAKIITVGSSDDRPGEESGKALYSGQGPTLSCICKPEVVAPGSKIRSCKAGWKRHIGSLYTSKSGTSMATPVVSGSLALLLSKERKLSNKEIKLRLYSCCKNLGLPRNRQGWGMIDVCRLLKG